MVFFHRLFIYLLYLYEKQTWCLIKTFEFTLSPLAQNTTHTFPCSTVLDYKAGSSASKVKRKIGKLNLRSYVLAALVSYLAWGVFALFCVEMHSCSKSYFISLLKNYLTHMCPILVCENSFTLEGID